MKLALLFVLFPFLCKAQTLPVTGEIISDKNFRCIDPIQPDSLEFGINEICRSMNYIEIRLKTNIMASTEMIVLSFNNDVWTAEKYYPEYKTKGRKIISTELMKLTKKDSAGQFNSLFDSLVMNRLFVVDDHKEVIKRQYDGVIVSDGVFYTVSFKVGDQFRRYRYGNPEVQTKYSKATEYKQVIAIIQLLNSIF